MLKFLGVKSIQNNYFNSSSTQNISLYHLKSWGFGYSWLVKRYAILSLILDGFPMKCLIVEKIKVAIASSYVFSILFLTISFFEFVSLAFNIELLSSNGR